MQKVRNVKISKNKVAIIFDHRKGKVVEGDTIQVGDYIAVFKKIKNA